MYGRIQIDILSLCVGNAKKNLLIFFSFLRLLLSFFFFFILFSFFIKYCMIINFANLTNNIYGFSFKVLSYIYIYIGFSLRRQNISKKNF
jgi:hypothetical protein